jgi:flagellin
VSFAINTNIASLQAQDYLRVNSDFQSKTINRVTSGLRIISSGDDAAGLAIANGYRSDQKVLGQGVRNANDGLSQLQIADGGISNISQLLDRARTLATQSASGTFTGDRGVLNSEFQSVIGEIDRQAQAIGLDQGGAFAKNLTVFIGGGKANTTTAIQNGSVSVDLSNSTVDGKSLGLKGVQAIGVAGTDIGVGSAATSVSAILANTVNTASEKTGGFTDFYFQGPGFGDSSRVKVSVNLTGVTDTNTLVNAINTAIQNAGNGATQSATAFKNAGISASVNTDASGHKQLAFNSSSTAFQVEAGDRVSQALLGNFGQNAVLTGTNAATTIATNGGGTAARLTLAVDGGSAFNVDLSGAALSATASKADIVRSLNSVAAFSSVATASLSGNQVVITSKGNSASSSVAITTTTLSTNLGLSGTAAAASASTGADLSTQVQANGNTAAGGTTFGAIGAGPVTFRFQGSGLTSPLDVTLTTTAAETVTQAVADLSSQVANNATLKAAGISLTTATAGDALTFTSSKGEQFSFGVTGDTQNLLGAGSFVSGAGNSFDYSALTAAAGYNSPAGAAAGTANLEFSINGGPSSGNLVSVNLGAGDATAASVAGTANAGTVNIDTSNNLLNVNVNGTGLAITLNSNTAATLGDIANQITSAFSGAGIAASASVVNNQLTITTTNKGADQSIQIAAGTANSALGLAASSFNNGTARSGASIATALNAAFAANSTLQAAGLTADYGVTAAGKITITSNNGTFFRADAYGSSAAATVTGTAGVSAAATAALRAGTTAGTYNITASNNIVSLKIDGGATQNITLTQGGARTAAQVAQDINNSLTGGIASVDANGHVQVVSNTTGAASSVQFLASVAATSGAGVGATAGPYAITANTNDVISVHVDGGTAQTVKLTAGAARTAAQIVADIQASNGGAGLVGATASVNGGGGVTITSNSTGATSSIQFDVNGTSTANATLGFTASTVFSGTNAVGSADTVLGFTAGTSNGTAASGGLTITGANDTLNISLNGGANTQVTLAHAAGVSAVTIAGEIQTQLGSGASVTVQNGRVQIASTATGSGASVAIAAGNANASLGFSVGTTTGTQADLGYGVTGATFATGNTSTAAPAVPAQIDAGGASQSAALAFTPIAYGSDAQTVSISANDSTGAAHSLSTILHNDATSRSGRSIDSAINAINTALQQSNDSTLQNIVAVKDNSSGSEQIRFLSAKGSFKVSIGTTAHATGIGSQGTTNTSTVSAGGSTADISTQTGALTAVNTLAAAVASLGSAQAVVGRGENQFNFAINLAQSQLTNLASAESRIRDADLASEAANLTKAQILLQAGVAALAQANSAPQAVLSLLKG